MRNRPTDEASHAPALLDYEIVSALRSLTLAGQVSTARAEDALRRRAFQLRDSVSAYDAAYVALAEALGCPLLTRDARLARSGGHGARIEVR